MWQAPARGVRRANSSTTSGLTRAANLKQGGRVSSALLQEQGAGRRGFPGRPACSFSPLFYDGAQSSPSEDGPRYDTSKLTVMTFGGNETKPGLDGGWEGEPLVACQKKGTLSRLTLQPAQTCVSRVSVSIGNAPCVYMRGDDRVGATNRHDKRAGGPQLATRPPFAMREMYSPMAGTT